MVVSVIESIYHYIIIIILLIVCMCMNVTYTHLCMLYIHCMYASKYAKNSYTYAHVHTPVYLQTYNIVHINEPVYQDPSPHNYHTTRTQMIAEQQHPQSSGSLS